MGGGWGILPPILTLSTWLAQFHNGPFERFGVTADPAQDFTGTLCRNDTGARDLVSTHGEDGGPKRK